MTTFNASFALALAATLATLAGLAGCAPPVHLISVSSRPAEAGFGSKETGDVRFMAVEGDEPTALVSLEHTGTLAQSGEGTLGDRLFREDEYGFVEACRWVAHGNVCQLVKTDDGEYLSSVSWIIPAHSKATPKMSGWVAKGVFLAASSRLDAEGQRVNSLAPVLVGRAFHCRFPNEGPQCIEVPATKKTFGYTLLGTFSLVEGGVTHEVLWVGLFAEVTAPGADRAFGIREIQRCETTEDSPQIDCKPVTLN
ncbi:hypothetical protein BH09MYX1_BH09MYX1_10750 [soil metagenome]